MIRTIRLPQIVCSGEDGSATGVGVSPTPLNGRLIAIHFNHGADGAATTDVTVATTAAPVQTLLVKADSATDSWFCPVLAEYMEVSVSAYAPPPVDDYVTVTVAGANDDQTLDVTLLVEE